jgi:carboxyl-terminal processing protease
MKQSNILKLLLAAALFLSFYLYWENSRQYKQPEQPLSADDDMLNNLGLFADAITIIDENYVKKVSSKEMIYGALDGMAAALDSHSGFLSPEQHEQLKADASGEFGGLGIKITVRDKMLTVVSPLEGSPAHQAGISPGDRIIKIDDKPTKDLKLDDAVELLRGIPGTTVELTIIKESDDSIIELEIKRAIIRVESIKYSMIIKDDIGYIKIADFQRHTASDLNKALRSLVKNGMKSLILDLRNNPGGLLEAAVMVSEKFLEKPLDIVSIEGRVAQQNVFFNARLLKSYTDFPMVVLINKGSASASEIVAGALGDNKRAVVAGQKSFGKGSVQTVIPMKDNSALRLTTSYYYTPSGRIIHDEGISPDLELEPGFIESGDDEEVLQALTDKERLLNDKQINEAILLLEDRQRYEDILK